MTGTQWQQVQGLTRQVLSRGTTEEISVSAEENKALARRWFEDLFNAGNLEVADEIIAQDHINHDPTLPDIPPGPEGQKQIVNLYRGAFTNAHISVEEQLAEGDRVVTRWTGSGTHQGELLDWDKRSGYRLAAHMESLLLDPADPQYMGGVSSPSLTAASTARSTMRERP